MQCLEEAQSQWWEIGGVCDSWWGSPTPHTTNLGLWEYPHYGRAPSDLGKDTARVGISRGKEREAAERSGGWLGGPYQSGSHIFNSPTALFQPLPIASSLLRSLLFFF